MARRIWHSFVPHAGDRQRRRASAVCVVVSLVSTFFTGAVPARAHSDDRVAFDADRETSTGSFREELGAEYVTSSDVLFYGRPDDAGFRVYKATKAEGWTWRLLATVRPEGAETTEWAGYHCATGDGTAVVSVVAPRSYVNHPCRA